jgi:hypothetical protein
VSKAYLVIAGNEVILAIDNMEDADEMITSYFQKMVEETGYDVSIKRRDRVDDKTYQEIQEVFHPRSIGEFVTKVIQYTGTFIDPETDRRKAQTYMYVAEMPLEKKK